MSKISEEAKSERKERVYFALQQHENGLTEKEISERLHLERRTVHNYLWELEAEGKIYKEDNSSLWMISPYEPVVLRKFELQPEQAMILYLAARLFVKQTDRRNETAELVLSRLANVLSGDMGLGEDLYNAARELAQRPKEPEYEDIFRTLMRSYIYRRQVQILYHPYRGEPFETIFSPYLLEPSAIGFSTYAIGHSTISNRLRTYKIERIERASLLMHNKYEIPADFPGLELLRNAWSIYYGEEVVRVVLRFHPEVARRVQETNWHPSQQLAEDEQNDGYLLLAFDVADTTDLKPWIRTWGANCEVLEPQSLRDELTGEARRLAHLYGWHTTTSMTSDHSRFDDIFGG
jgi:predicted DNA-binding transcriptional regulator YafY